MKMTDAALIGIVASIPATLTAFAGILVAIRNGKKTDEIGKNAETAVNSAIKKTEEIHILVNSNLTQLKNDLKNANVEIESLKSMIAALTGKIPVIVREDKENNG